MTQRGVFDPITLAFVLVTVLMIVAGIALSVGVKCDPSTQHCIDYGSGTVEAPK